jgi:ABC-2 type transport system permease protein
LFVVMPLSGVFYPVAALPWFLRPLATALPTTHAFAAGRGLIDGHGMQWGQLGLAAAATVVAAGAALWFLARMLGTFRRRGFVTRYS